MATIPILVGVTPCCGNILRSSTRAIALATQKLSRGVCPDCDTELDSSDITRVKCVQRARAWFRGNAKYGRGGWSWNAAEAFVAYLEIHNLGGVR